VSQGKKGKATGAQVVSINKAFLTKVLPRMSLGKRMGSRLSGGLKRLGHASIVMTMDTYGHLFPRNDNGTELAAAASALLA
jgi:integrase